VFKLKLPLILACVQFMIAVLLLNQAHSDHSGARFDTPYGSTAAMVCYGVNAPALLFRAAGALLPNRDIWAFGSDELLFLVGVICLWVVLDQVIASRSASKQLAQREPAKEGVGKAAMYLLLAAWGIYLAYLALDSALHLGRWNNPTGNIVDGILFGAWALILLFFCFTRIRRIYRFLAPHENSY
jgi:hypothetical protein